ncbi:hypothetical protein PsYK624_138200 [Phanerochaete sordida]|uniref:Uncharacterized protein n=1 Tax=Phanerochaete sordida TaxID=48140 RepID=A0A9P3LKD9_9APHY|nr:hypothetical protein PsYK624_138200 [Phanerochaete sordida]
MNNQPAELIDKVFEELALDKDGGYEALHSCIKVNKALRALGRRFAWKSVECLPRGHPHSYISASDSPWEKQTKFFHTTPDTSQLVKHITVIGVKPEYIYDEEESYLFGDLLASVPICAINNLISALPNLTSLYLDRVAIHPCLHKDHESYLPAVLQLPALQKLALQMVVIPNLDNNSTTSTFLQIPSITSEVYAECKWLTDQVQYEDNDDPNRFNSIIPPPLSLSSHVCFRVTQFHLEYLKRTKGLKRLEIYDMVLFGNDVDPHVDEVIKNNKDTLESLSLESYLAFTTLASHSQCTKLKDFTYGIVGITQDSTFEDEELALSNLIPRMPKNLSRIRLTFVWGSMRWYDYDYQNHHSVTVHASMSQNEFRERLEGFFWGQLAGYLKISLSTHAAVEIEILASGHDAADFWPNQVGLQEYIRKEFYNQGFQDVDRVTFLYNERYPLYSALYAESVH